MNPSAEPDGITYTKVASVLITVNAVFQTTLFIYLQKISLKQPMLLWLLCGQTCVAVNENIQSGLT